MCPERGFHQVRQRDIPKSFTVNGLFDQFNHEINLPQSGDPVRFLTAPNGYGKSTILRLLADLTNQDHLGVACAFWSSLVTVFESGAVLRVTRHVSGRECRSLEYSYERPDSEPVIEKLSISEIRRMAHRISRSRSRQSARENVSRYYPGATAAAADELREEARAARRRVRVNADLRHAMRSINAGYLDVHRLAGEWSFHVRRRPTVANYGSVVGDSAVRQVAVNATAALRKAHLKYLEDSRKDEETFASRVVEVLNAGAQESVGGSDVMSRQLTELKDLYRELVDLGVVSPFNSQTVDVLKRLKDSNEAAVSVVRLYWNDLLRRLRRLRTRVKALGFYRQSVNSLLGGKQLRFRSDCHDGENEGQGVEVVAGERPIPLESLSDGEQHLLVIFGELLFGKTARPRGLLLLDEPENSLHPEWQASLGAILGSLAESSRTRVLVATHSPIIIGDLWEKEISLDRRGAK